MAKDYAKFVPSRPRQPKQSGWRKAIIPIFGMLILLVVSAGYFVYQKKSSTAMAENPKVNAFVAKITALLGHHKKDPSTAVTEKPKALASAQNDPTPPVQVDFYSELPKLQVTLPETVATTAPPRISKPVNTAPAANTATPAAAPVVVAAVATEKPVVANAAVSQMIFKPEELDGMVVTDEQAEATKGKIKAVTAVTAKAVVTKTVTTKAVGSKGDQYLLHLGSFDTQKAAKIWRAALADVGFQADIAQESKNGHAVYHVRQGPFASVSLAKMSQQKLQKRGITSSIIKKV